MNNDSHVKKSEVIHKNSHYSVRMDTVTKPDGSEGKFYIVDKEPSAFIIAITDEQKIVLIKQFRYTANAESIEVPAGGSDGEDLLDTAKKELQEETGYTASSWESVGSLTAAIGISSISFETYIARGLHQTGIDEKDEEGITEVMEVSFTEFENMVADGKIIDAGTVASYFLAKLHIEKHG